MLWYTQIIFILNPSNCVSRSEGLKMETYFDFHSWLPELNPDGYWSKLFRSDYKVKRRKLGMIHFGDGHKSKREPKFAWTMANSDLWTGGLWMCPLSISAKFSAQYSLGIRDGLLLSLPGGIGGPPPVHMHQPEVTQEWCQHTYSTSGWRQYSRVAPITTRKWQEQDSSKLVQFSLTASLGIEPLSWSSGSWLKKAILRQENPFCAHP